MVAAAESILSHFDGIISFAHSRITNAFMEGLNSVFSAVKRKASDLPPKLVPIKMRELMV